MIYLEMCENELFYPRGKVKIYRKLLVRNEITYLAEEFFVDVADKRFKNKILLNVGTTEMRFSFTDAAS